MDFKITGLKTDLKKIPKFDKRENAILILINGISLLFSVVNANIGEKNFTNLIIEIGVLITYLISSILILKQKGPLTTTTLHRVLCISTIIIVTVINLNPFHLFHILFLFFLSLTFKVYREVLFYPILSFVIFILKLQASLSDKIIISCFSFLSLIIFVVALKEKKPDQPSDSSKKQKRNTEEIDKEIMIMNEATKLAALTEMSNGVAHEINNPLTIIAGVIQIVEMKMENKKLKDDDLRNLLETVTAATERASHVVRSLEEFSRDGSKDPFQIISLKTLCLDSVDIFKERCSKLEILIKTEKLKPLFINCKAVQIVQTLFHLISNSIYEIVNLKDRWIEFESKEDNSSIYLRLTDSGFGIPQEVVKSMFEPFVSQKAESLEATGLGLSIAKIILSEHKGNISYELYKGHTSFLLKFPKPKS